MKCIALSTLRVSIKRNGIIYTNLCTNTHTRATCCSTKTIQCMLSTHLI